MCFVLYPLTFAKFLEPSEPDGEVTDSDTNFDLSRNKVRKKAMHARTRARKNARTDGRIKSIGNNFGSLTYPISVD